MMIRDDWRECHEVTRVEVTAFSTLMAEALAIYEGCVLARWRNLTHIIVELDSKQVILFLNYGLECSTWEVFPIVS